MVPAEMTTAEGFENQARIAFAFLVERGFRLTSRETWRLAFASPTVVVTVEWDPRSGELNVFVARHATNEACVPISLADILTMVGKVETGLPFQVPQENRLLPFLERSAMLLREHAKPALDGDRMFFHSLRAFRNAQSPARTVESRLRQIRTEAELAWQSRDFAVVVELYSSISERLSALETKKLEYALRHKA